MPIKENTKREKIEKAVEEVRLAMIENITVNDMEVEVKHRKTAAHFRLQKAKEELHSLERELLD